MYVDTSGLSSGPFKHVEHCSFIVSPSRYLQYTPCRQLVKLGISLPAGIRLGIPPKLRRVPRHPLDTQ